MKKTIFITSCHPLISRNIFSTGLIGMLDQQVVLIVPTQKVEYFKKHFPQAIVEGVDLHTTKREGCMKYLSLTALNTTTLSIKRQTEMKGSGSILTKFISNRCAHACIRFVERISYRSNLFSDLFNKYKPSSVFCTDIQNETDIALLIEAKKNNIKTIGMVRSWDNLTSKGLIRSVPDRLLVWNDIVKKEAITLHDINPQIISVIGIPHYDTYVQTKEADRQAFFRKIGGNPDKKLALVVPIGDRYIQNNTIDRDIVDILDKELSSEYEILVRLPPGDYVRELEKQPHFSRKILYDRAETNPDNIKTTEIKKDDDTHLINTLFFADIVVSGPSTMVIDAAVMNKHIVLFGFDGHEKRDYLSGIGRYYDYDNFVPVIESGGVQFAKSLAQFYSFIKSQGPNKEKVRELALLEVTYLDGKNTERLARELST